MQVVNGSIASTATGMATVGYYDWDPEKNALNQINHGVAFEAVETFEWETAEVDVDDREDYGELRERAVGFIGDTLYVLIFTCRTDDDDDDEDVVRVISLRKATRLERKRYAD